MLRKVEMGWERGEMSWAEAEVRRSGKSWRRAEASRVEKSEDEVRRGESRWGELRRAGKRWKELSWGGGGMEQLWELLKRVAKIKRNWDGLRRAEKRWSQLKRNEAKWHRTQRTELPSCVRFRGSSYRQNLFLGSKSSMLLIIGNFCQPAYPGFTCRLDGYWSLAGWYFFSWVHYYHYFFGANQAHPRGIPPWGFKYTGHMSRKLCNDRACIYFISMFE